MNMVRAVAALAMALAVGHAAAEAYPARPVTLILPLGAGGAMDILARGQFEPKLKERLGSLDAKAIAELDPPTLEAAFREKPAVHRFPGNMARRVQELCATLVDEYGGTAGRLGTGAAAGQHLRP